MEVRPACPASWPCPSTNHPRAIGNRGSPAGSAGYSKQDLNRSNTKSPWSANRGDRTYKEGVGGSSPSAPTRNVEKSGHFAALEAMGKCPCPVGASPSGERYVSTRGHRRRSVRRSPASLGRSGPRSNSVRAKSQGDRYRPIHRYGTSFHPSR